MITNQIPAVAADAPPADAWLTATNLGIIAICAVLALLVIWWGAKLKRERQAVEHAIGERAEHPIATVSLDDPLPAPETNPIPVASPPPPLAETPVVAAPRADPPLAPPAAEPEASSHADDLTLLKGVGPRLVARLGELGITRFAQIAALSPAEADALDAQLGSFQGRIARDRWVEQAGYLAKGDRAGFEAAFGRL